MLRAAVVLAVSVLVSTSAASAQVRPAPAAGDHVRLRSGDLSGTFTVMDMNGDSMTLKAAADGTTRSVSLRSLERVDIYRGERSRAAGALRGAAFGAGFGMVLGAVIGYADGNDDPQTFLAYTAAEKAAIMGIMLGGTGVVVGGTIGMVAPGGRWQRADVRRVSVLPAPAGGVTLSFSSGL